MSDLIPLRAALEALADQLLVHDLLHFRRLLDRARADRFDARRFERDVEQALQRAEHWRRALPEHIDYPAELPVVQAREAVLGTLRAHPVVIVCGETGSGKTTQLPKLCLELGRGTRGLIGHTQPRRLAARSVASRIAQELHGSVGQRVGFETRFDRRMGEASRIKLMTDGILLAELARDHRLTAYDTLIIDEAHERSLNIDFLLGYLKRLLPQRPDLKLIVTSATLDPERLSRHFDGAPIVEVSGRTYPVEMRYRPPDDETDAEGAIADAVASLWGHGPGRAVQGRPHPPSAPQTVPPPPAGEGIPAPLRGRQDVGDVLVFLPGEREIRDAARVLGGRFPQAEVLPLYSRLAATAQDQVFSPSKRPRIVLATNVAETSLTVPGIRYVVDTGTARIGRYAPRTGVQQLHIEPVSQASANQRAGRCGRLGPGVCIRLYAQDDFAARPVFTDPEIRRANLAGVILQMAALRLGRIEDFPWVEAPDGRHVAEAQRVLQLLGAFDDAGHLTSLGRELARLPLDPRIARIALAGRGSIAQAQVFVLAAALSVPDPHEVPADAQDAARQQHAAWRHPRSDFLTLLQLWQQWRQWSAQASNRQLRRLCRDHYVSFLRMEEWEAVHRQILDLLGERTDEKGDGKRETQKQTPWTTESLDALYAPIHQALLAGLIDHVGQKVPESAEYQGPKGRRFRLHPGSVLAKKAPAWVMSAQLASTTRLYARTNAAIEPEWLEQVGAHLIKRALLHPHWNAERGEVSATEHLTLLGLPLLTRKRHYGSTHPVEAREIFIRDALVGGQIPRKPAFLERNLQLIEDVRDKEIRLRRPDLLADDAQLCAWYAQRLPADIFTTAALRRALQDPRQKAQAAQLTMQETDVLRPGASADVETLFPDHLQLGALRVPISYRHDPGAAHDGVTFHVAITQLHALPAELFGWLVPGLRTDLIEGLIRSLPNRLRRYCTPAAEFASALAARLEPPAGQLPEGDLLLRLCAALKAMTGLELTPADFEPERLEDYLRPRFRLEDDRGHLLAEADSLSDLRARHGGAARAAMNAAVVNDPVLERFVRSHVQDWDFDTLPERVQLRGGASAYPALSAADMPGTPKAQDLSAQAQSKAKPNAQSKAPSKSGSSTEAKTQAPVELRLFESRDAADAAHAGGVRALLLEKMADRQRDLAKHAKSRLALLLVPFGWDIDTVTQAIARHAADALLDGELPRTPAAFQAVLERRAAFSLDARRRVDDVADWLTTARTLEERLRGFGDRWPLSVTDMRGQLRSLLAPALLDVLPAAQWPRIAVYLKALEQRIERLPNKPARDEDLSRELTPLVKALPQPLHPARWVLEEWRIVQFAQQLKAQGAPSVARFQQALQTGV